MSEQQPGRRLGKYVMMYERIGQGAMGDVYRGEDTRTGRPLAIKAIKAEVFKAEPTMGERFEREAEALRKLNHPNIVKTFGRITQDDETFLLMEFVGGGDLRTLLERDEQLPVRQVMEIGLDLSDALARAHRLNVIHRDIKPANVMLAEDGTPRLTDFGISKMTDRTAMTESGYIIGTYAYMSPEQAMGEKPDQRADIWAFGIMIYELLAGVRPFDGDNPMALLRAIIADPMPDISQYRSDIPPGLNVLIMQMLQKDAQKRISSARLVGSQLEALLNGTATPIQVVNPISSGILPEVTVDFEDSSVSATPTPPISSEASQRLAEMQAALSKTPTQPEPAIPAPIVDQPPTAKMDTAQPTQRQTLRTVITTVLVTLLVLIGLGVALVFNANRPPDLTNAVVEPVSDGAYMVLVAQFEPIGRQTEPQDVQRFITEDLQAVFEQSVPFSQIEVRSVPVELRTPEQALAVAEMNSAPVIIWGSYDDQIGVRANVHLGSIAGLPDSGLNREQIEEVVNITVTGIEPRRETLAYLVVGVLNGASAARNDGYQVAQTLSVLDALELEDRAVAVGGGSVGANWNRYVSNFLGNTEFALENIERAIELAPTNPLLYLSAGFAQQRLGDFESSYALLDTSLRLATDNPEWVAPHFNIGIQLLLVDEDYPAALDEFDSLLAVRSDDWFYHTLRGGTLILMDEIDAAHEAFLTAIDNGADLSIPYVFVLATTMRRGEIRAALELNDTLVNEYADPVAVSRITRAAYGDTIPNPFDPVVGAFVNFLIGQQRTALEYANQALEIEALENMPDVYLIKGLIYCNMGDYRSAEAAYTAAIERSPEYALPYMLRAEVKQLQPRALLRMRSIRSDLETAIELSPNNDFDALIALGLAGEVGCNNFFSYDFDAVDLDDIELNRDSILELEAQLEEQAAADAPPPPPQALGVSELLPGYAPVQTILVAQFEPFGDTSEQNIQRLMLVDLRNRLERAAEYSPYRVMAYPEIVRTAEEAAQAAEENDASLVVWGSYDARAVEVNIQIGSLQDFDALAIDPDQIFELANHTVIMPSAEENTVGVHVLAAYAALHMANNDPYGAAMTYALKEHDLREPPLRSQSPGVSALWHGAFGSAIPMPDDAMGALTEAITLSPENPLLYATRALLYAHSGQFEPMLEDVETANQLSEAAWILPEYLLIGHDLRENELDEAIARLNEMIEQHPDAWFAVTLRGIGHLLQNDVDGAQQDLSRVVNEQPPVVLPHMFLTLVEVRKGNVRDAQDLLNVIATQPSNTVPLDALFDFVLGPGTPLAVVTQVFDDFVVRDYEDVLVELEELITFDLFTEQPDPYLLAGFAYCNLRDFSEAEDAYSRGIDLNDDLAMLYLLRAEVRLKQDERLAAVQDLRRLSPFTDLPAQMRDLLPDQLRDLITPEDIMNCEQLFDS